jgi:hypothetical protein
MNPETSTQVRLVRVGFKTDGLTLEWDDTPERVKEIVRIIADFAGNSATKNFRQNNDAGVEMTPNEKSHGSTWYPLFEHMIRNHALTLLDDELNTIACVADESRLHAAGGVAWILVNALRHLTCDELHDLGEAIAKRSGGTYSPN